MRPDLDVVELRGNVDTPVGEARRWRLRRHRPGRAGFERLTRADEGKPIGLTPAAGQGCLALEARTDGQRMRDLSSRLTHRDSLVCLTAERAVVSALDATCRTP